MQLATGVLLFWKRPENLLRVIDRMLAEKWIARIVVWSNRSKLTTARFRTMLRNRFPLCPPEVIGSGTNVYTFGRYLAMQAAETDLIVTCDDDCVVDNWHDLACTQAKSGRLVANIQPRHYDHFVGRGWTHPYSGGVAYEALVGWGAAFDRSTTLVLDRYIAKFGVDALLHRKADRFFTILQNQEHALLRHAVENLPGCEGAEALYHLPDHWTLNREAVQRSVEILEAEACMKS